jgi:predicted nucleic acid-binding protein
VRIFLDANILFSAARSDGAIRALLKLWIEDGRHVLVADAFVVEEARRNLERKSADGAAAREALEALLTVVEVARAGSVPEEKWLAWLPEKDRPVLAAAARCGCEVLVTGDRTHFGSGFGKRFGGVLVLSPALAASL